jgi:hypothetical protein
METVLYAPGAAANLMSVSRMTKEGGLNITFTDDVHIYMIDSQGNIYSQLKGRVICAQYPGIYNN